APAQAVGRERERGRVAHADGVLERAHLALHAFAELGEQLVEESRTLTLQLDEDAEDSTVECFGCDPIGQLARRSGPSARAARDHPLTSCRRNPAAGMGWMDR